MQTPIWGGNLPKQILKPNANAGQAGLVASDRVLAFFHSVMDQSYEALVSARNMPANSKSPNSHSVDSVVDQPKKKEKNHPARTHKKK